MEGSPSEEMVVIKMLAFGCSDKAFQSTTVCKIQVCLKNTSDFYHKKDILSVTTFVCKKKHTKNTTKTTTKNNANFIEIKFIIQTEIKSQHVLDNVLLLKHIGSFSFYQCY